MATDALTRSELIEELVERGAGDKKHVSNMLKKLAELAGEELAAGHDFSVPGIVNIRFRYQPAQKKGERFKKGDEVTGFGGVTEVKDADSPARKEKFILKPALIGQASKAKPGTKPEAQAAYAKSPAGKAVKKRLNV